MEPIISVKNVGMRFNLASEKVDNLKEFFIKMTKNSLKFEEFWALDDVSIDIMPGDFYGLVGLNGSGKSTLLKTIAGVLKPTKGSVTVRGTIAGLMVLESSNLPTAGGYVNVFAGVKEATHYAIKTVTTRMMPAEDKFRMLWSTLYAAGVLVTQPKALVKVRVKVA